ncbi:MAG: hypothetical protein LQ350_004617 [Teloschistes chrysophthalmus]|nr:MAG: hypothetical protein LQ350_004617 [Niorma chrysophthalma]
MASSPSTASRIRGSLYGVAICDALGGPVEFSRRGSFPPVTHLLYCPHFHLPPGCWTDDTSMTFCLAQSLVDKKGQFDLGDQVWNYLKWASDGYMSSIGRCFDIGNATRTALGIWNVKFARFGKPARVRAWQESIDYELKKKVHCGNGSLMRVSPIGLVYHKDPQKAMDYAAASSQVTHPYPTNAEACKIYTKLIASTFSNLGKVDLASIVADWQFEDPDLKARFEKYGKLEDWQQVQEEAISSSGYVVHTLEASLWAFFSTESFEEGGIKAVNLGDDADTVGAIYGGIAGAYYGSEALPKRWLDGLQARDVLDPVVDGVVALLDGD